MSPSSSSTNAMLVLFPLLLLTSTTVISADNQKLQLQPQAPATKTPTSPVAQPIKPPAKPSTPTPPAAPLKPPTSPVASPPTPFRPPVKPEECGTLCAGRCKLHSRPAVCARACSTCCVRCKCVPPGTYGNRELCGTCYTDMRTHGNRFKCP